MKFIELTYIDDEKTLVNIENISHIDSKGDVCIIWLKLGQSPIEVIEPLKIITQLLTQ